ncbi:uncharacterized protein isoform X3 [Leptinotarsa decemlineata]|uniref:uncharacterized protein isoform X3 n=1 Tax=Leptinotarsa decemlineata TaxID=7539 RepID=UPI003D30A35B
MDVDVDGFLKVSYKSRNSKNRTGRITQTKCDIKTNTSLSLSLDKEYFLKKICEAKSEVLSSDLFKSVCTSLKEGLFILNDSAIAEIVCLGLGRIGFMENKL